MAAVEPGGLFVRLPHAMPEPADLRVLFHRLNNQLGIILAHAELIEARAADQAQHARAAQVVSSALDAMTTAREIREQVVGETHTDTPHQR